MLLNAHKDIGLAVNTGKTNYMETGRHRGIIANEHVRICSIFYEKVETFTYLDSLVTNQSYIQDDIKYRLKAGNSCYYSVQPFLSSRLHSTNLKIKIYKTIILLDMLYGPETWSLTLREEYTLRISEDRILGRIFGPKRNENWE